MGRGVSSGGGQSSLAYLFGSGEAPKATTNGSSKHTTNGSASAAGANAEAHRTLNEVAKETLPKSSTSSPPEDNGKQVPAGIPGNKTNNYFRADGQNCGNFLTDRPTTKVHAAPGGGSSLDYLFGGNGK